MKIESISIIFPFYNEQNRLAECFKDIKSFNKNNSKIKKEYIFVNDGSFDKSEKLINNFIKKTKNNKSNYKIISLKKNSGKGFAIKKGILKAKGKWILTLDIDISVSLTQINLWLKKGYIDNKNNIYFGSRNVKGSILNLKIYRKIIGYFFNFILKFFLKINLFDSQCGFKLYPKKIAKIIFSNLREKGFVHDVEIILISNKKKIAIKELPVKWSHVDNSKLNLVKDSLKMFFGILRLRKYLRS
jgi:dolichyl-phosphate beta-glucosyltransferase